jgi:hypothetical protein
MQQPIKDGKEAPALGFLKTSGSSNGKGHRAQDLLITSRREKELEERLQPIITDEVPIQGASVDADINVYVIT